MKPKLLFRVAFYHIDESLIFTTLVWSTTFKGAQKMAEKLEPFEWHKKLVKQISNFESLEKDKKEFNY